MVTSLEVTQLHENSDKDGSTKAIHHTLGSGSNQASPGNHIHDGGSSPIVTPLDGITLTGSRASGAALVNIIEALKVLGAIDGTTA